MHFCPPCDLWVGSFDRHNLRAMSTISFGGTRECFYLDKLIHICTSNHLDAGLWLFCWPSKRVSMRYRFIQLDGTCVFLATRHDEDARAIEEMHQRDRTKAQNLEVTKIMRLPFLPPSYQRQGPNSKLLSKVIKSSQPRVDHNMRIRCLA